MNEELETGATEETLTEPAHIYYAEETESIDSGKIPVWQQLTLLAVLMFLLLGGAITPKIIAFFAEEKDSIPASVPTVETEGIQRDQIEPGTLGEPFSDIQIQGAAAYVWDIQNQRALYKKNELESLPLASVTKLMTALVADELLSEEEGVAIDTESVKQYGNSGFLEGEVFGRLTLTDITLMSSSNDGAYALAAAAGDTLNPGKGATAFVHAMNVRANELGLLNTSFKNPTGLDISETESGAEGSAKDMAFLMEYIVLNNPNILSFTTEEEVRVYSENGVYHDAENTNYYIDEIPGLIGSKTGYTDLAGGNLVVAFNAGLNRPIVISVLGSTRQERFSDVIALVAASQQFVTQQ